MSASNRVVAVTGANGYLGGVLIGAFARSGWRTIPMVRTSRGTAGKTIAYDLSHPVAADSLRGIDVLVHCAYDLTLTSRRRIWEVNVAGARRLFEAARTAGVKRCIAVSSIAAFAGSKQRYGAAKLAIEQIALEHGAVVIRPGLVFGPHAGGMVGALRRSLSLPVVPLFAGHSHQYLVHEYDLADAVIRLASTATPPRMPVTVAHPEPISTAELLHTIARADSHRVVLIPVPWQLAFLALKAAEGLGAKLPFRSDSLWGLAHPAPPPSLDALQSPGIRLRRFPTESEVPQPQTA